MQVASESLRGRNKTSSSSGETGLGGGLSSLLPSALRFSHDRDEELGKRDDDYMPSSHHHHHHHRKKSSSGGSHWAPNQSGNKPQRWRRRRAFAIIGLLLAAVYLFIRNIPTDLTPAPKRQDWRVPGSGPGGRVAFPGGPPPRGISPVGNAASPPAGAPPRPNGKPGSAAAAPAPGRAGSAAGGNEEEHYYSGPIKFYHLKSTLDAILMTGGRRTFNRNVLFAASSLKSAANLLPMACSMASFDRAVVHFVLLGRSAVPLKDVLDINHIEPESCNVYFHDGRADYSEYSSDVRAEASVVGAMNHINQYMHPQVVIVDDAAVEDAFFSKGIKGKMKDLQVPVIELPEGKHMEFGWMTMLDSVSLSNWHKPRIEILVHSPPNAGGGLVRLLKGLTEANLAGFSVPKLTIELPARIEGYLRGFLWEFQWPKDSGSTDLLKLHRRVSSGQLGSEESSVRFVEAYYPAKSADDHVLVLSANAEVSPLFYHYAMWMLLSTKYSAYDKLFAYNLAGFALAAPRTLLDGQTKFKSPKLDQLTTELKEAAGTKIASPPFLWQAPQSDALLIYGDRWSEFHDFLSRRLDKLHKAGKKAPRPKRLVSADQPAWLEFLLELTRARGWNYLYPPNSDSGTWTTIHNELYQPPEEMRSLLKAKKPRSSDDTDEKLPSSDEPFLASDAAVPPRPSGAEPRTASSAKPLHELLPFDGDMPPLFDLPLLSWSGEWTLPGPAHDAADSYALSFRSEHGGCDTAAAAKQPKKSLLGRAGDLFCYAGKEGDEWDASELDFTVFTERERDDDLRGRADVLANARVASLPPAAKLGQGHVGVATPADIAAAADPAAAAAAAAAVQSQGKGKLVDPALSADDSKSSPLEEPGDPKADGPPTVSKKVVTKGGSAKFAAAGASVGGTEDGEDGGVVGKPGAVGTA